MRVNPYEHLKSGGRATLGSAASGSRMRQTLIAAEVALSIVLLTAAALLTASFGRIMGADRGFEAPAVLTTDIQIPRQQYKQKADRDRFHERVLANLTAQPGVVSAGIVTALPLTGETWIDAISVPGDKRPGFERPSANVRFASADYFRTMGIPMLAGRTFSENDRKRKVTIISERVAATLWPGQNAVGRNLDRNGDPFEVIGIVRDVKTDADKPAPLMMYRPYWDWSPSRVRLVARSNGDPRAAVGGMRAAVRSADANVPVQQFQTMRELLDDSVAQRRLQTLLICVFAGTALLLAAFGIYGVVAYSVTRRRSEMGLRIALGARPGDLYSLVVWRNMRPVVAGLLLGVPAALAAGQALTSLLYEVRPNHPAIIAGVPALLLCVALFACLIPARRTTKVPPLETLRSE